ETAMVAVANGNGSYDSGPLPTSAAGDYSFVASYSGDGTNSAETTSCQDLNEAITVNKASLTIVTQASTPTVPGGSISDTATVTGGFLPTGSLTFDAFGPNDNTNCDTTPAFTSTTNIAGDGTVSSDSFPVTAPGNYDFTVTYSGDTNNAPQITACNVGAETADVNTAQLKVTPTFPASVTVGDGLDRTTPDPVSITVTNEEDTAVQVSQVTLVPACGTTSATPDGDCPASNADPSVFQVATSGSGAAGTSCVGEGFDITTLDASTGEVQLVDQANGGLINLGAAGTTGTTGDTCTIDFTVAVAQGPTQDADPATPGVQTAQLATATIALDPPNGIGTSLTTVNLGQPDVFTNATQLAQPGDQIQDLALVQNTGFGPNPTGTVTFELFGPGNTSCAGEPLDTSSGDVDPTTGDASSALVTVSDVGVYQWVAIYSGDQNNNTEVSACGSETTDVQAPTAITTTPSATTVALGQPISDSATLTGSNNPTGTIEFDLFAPGQCGNREVGPVFTSTVQVDGNGTYESPTQFTPTEAGSFDWVAVYSGDTDNASAASTCGDETVDVTAGSPTLLTTEASPSVPLGGTLFDDATLSGGSSPTGTITFSLFGPNPDGCGGTPAFTSMATVDGNGGYSSDIFTPTEQGTYIWQASYSGDAANAPATASCDDPAESVTVTAAVPTLTTQASAAVTIGGAISDTADLEGTGSPTGTITFQAFVVTEGCEPTAVFTSTVTVGGNGTYTSDTFTPTSAGTYAFVASYSGDTNNAAVTTSCGDPGESVTVSAAQPSISTSATSARSATSISGISDTATLTGGDDPTGTITFDLYPEGDTFCRSDPIRTFSVAVNGDGSYSSPAVPVTVVGTYQWVASYSGDSNNFSADGACGDPGETSTLQAVPSLTTQASPNAVLGGSIFDTATLTGGANVEQGSITFTIFGPGGVADCDATALNTSTAFVDGDGSYDSAPFVPTQPGTYEFVASYSGDPLNTPVTTHCGDPSESVVVGQVGTGLTTQASAGIALG
ncbi:MAG: beta strand repeat-containing protein, partial [Acidimicrobiales bacterium]